MVDAQDVREERKTVLGNMEMLRLGWSFSEGFINWHNDGK